MSTSVSGRRRSASQRARAQIDLSLASDSEDDHYTAANGRQKKRKRSPTPLDDVDDDDVPALGEEEYEIDYIVDSRFATYGSKTVLEYFIHWKGYPIVDREWTLADQLDEDSPCVVAFHKKNPFKPHRKQRTVLSLMSANQPMPKKPKQSGKPHQSTAKPGKENRKQPIVVMAAPKKRGVTPEPKKREVTPEPQISEDDDFVMEEDDGDEDDEDEFAEEEFAMESDPETTSEVDVDEPEEQKPAQRAKKTSGGWAVRVKAPKKAAVKLTNFKTGVTPIPGLNADAKGFGKAMSEELPPISDIGAIFDHLSSRMPSIVDVIQRLNGRKLRVATMCSGTESPLLALNMMADAIKAKHGVTFGVDHVFSCEIEPFKQAYIERNFAPPILFRDVTELGRSKAHTAYGSLVDVPGDVDMLIAGTSCVDYSGLNNEKQDITANGESGRTFRGMLQWVNKHRPPIVILENVCSAPWDKVVQYFGQIDYDSQYVRLDTKEFYIPHTRTRVYLFATPRTAGTHLPEKWVETVRALRRPWSSSFEAFLLPTDDPNIHRARLDLAAAKYHRDGTQRKATDWGRCESRHARARQEEELGNLRPLTAWQEAGVCKGLDWTWNDYLLSQTERVVDLLDISTLRMAKEGMDTGYKACIWNVSQNVDRQTGSSRTALAQCLTPNMIPWVTNRGGPVTGREALALQGIPVQELLLTSENEDQLADLAGNAMTTTVVGASMLAALAISLPSLVEGRDAAGEAAKEHQKEVVAEAEAADRIVGTSLLESHPLDLAKVRGASLADVMEMAERSSRHCVCEGQSGTAASPIDECLACGYRACQNCGGRPEHVYSPCNNVRLEPSEFEKHFKELLPMRVKIAGLYGSSLSQVHDHAIAAGKGQIAKRDWNLWTTAVGAAVQDAEFRFRKLVRRSTWTAEYESPSAKLELWLQAPAPEWRLTIKPPSSEPVNSRLRYLLRNPVARLRVNLDGHDVLGGTWEVCAPSQRKLDVEIKGCGELVPTWQASLGLQGKFEGTSRWSQVQITVPSAADKTLDRPLSGMYTLLPKCGQAMSSLHVKEPSDSSSSPLYFFLDPTRYGDAADDRYIFSTSIERLDFNTERVVLASLDSQWRESSTPTETVSMDVEGGWVQCEEARLTAVGGNDIAIDDDNARRDEATYSVPMSSQAVSEACKDCTHAAAILSVTVPLEEDRAEPMWKKGTWGEVDLQHEGNTAFANLAWITERLPPLDLLSSWNHLDQIEATNSVCTTCAPRPPTIHWMKQVGKLNKNGHKTKSTIEAFEDRLEAGRYEYALKNRPSPFVLQLRHDNRSGTFRIGLNGISLSHRALARLPQSDSKGCVRLSWRLTTGHVADVPEPPRVFTLPSNKQDPPHRQPAHFRLTLRPEQLRSLWWMLQQERAEGKDYTFIEEEISEATLPALGWRAEGKAERPVMVRGGVIADQVGYGKTIISLALVAETKSNAAPTPPPRGLIDSKATLIVVPGHLSKQWPSEIKRFTGDTFRTIVIQNLKDLQDRTINELSSADIIILASEIFESDLYWQRMEYLSAQPDDWLNDKQGGRFFAERLDSAISSLSEQTEILKSQGSAAAHANQTALHKKAVSDAEGKQNEMKAASFGKRLKGAAYRDKFDASTSNKHKVSKSARSPWEVDEAEDEELVDMAMVSPKLTFRKESGFRSLTSTAVEGDFTRLTCPLFHMFRFRRIIADEFTYLEKKGLASILRLNSCFKWVLSGTPPVNDFPAIRSIAAFMGIHLGVEDDAEGSAQFRKARAKEQTAAERFHAFRETHSLAWHRRRDDLAQEFLNIFVRQNIAEIDDIPTVEHIHTFKLPASEGAVYLELEHHLQALEMQARKETKFKNVSQGDRNARLEEALADSKTAEEALLKRCCHFTLDLTDKKRDAKSAREACEHITNARQAQLDGCEADLERSINLAVGLHSIVRKKGGFGKSDTGPHPFRDWIQLAFDDSKHQGDSEAAVRLLRVLRKCGFKSVNIPDTPADGKTPKAEAKAPVEDIKWDLREQTHLLRRLSKELVARVRSLRFFEVVRKLQRNGPDAAEVLERSACGHSPSADVDLEMAVLSCCGHLSCYSCMVEAANNQRCIKGDACHAHVRLTNIVKVSALGIEGELSSGRYGAKLQRLVDLIKSIPENDRVLVFNQWEDLSTKIGEALTAGGVKHVTLSGSVKRKADTLDKFQSGSGSDRVLLLKVNDASAAGSNLTTANHVIFLGPLFTPTLLNYRAVETQAIGRIRRFGQQKEVHIHRLLALDTIDMSIYESRVSELRSKPDYIEIPQAEYIPQVRKSNKKRRDAIEDL